MVGAERVRPAGHWRLNRAVTSWHAAAVLTGASLEFRVGRIRGVRLPAGVKGGRSPAQRTLDAG